MADTQMDCMEFDDDDVVAAPEATLEIYEAGDCVEKHPLELPGDGPKWEFICGRSAESDACLNDPSISQKHATIGASRPPSNASSTPGAVPVAEATILPHRSPTPSAPTRRPACGSTHRLLLLLLLPSATTCLRSDRTPRRRPFAGQSNQPFVFDRQQVRASRGSQRAAALLCTAAFDTPRARTLQSTHSTLAVPGWAARRWTWECGTR